MTSDTVLKTAVPTENSAGEVVKNPISELKKALATTFFTGTSYAFAITIGIEDFASGEFPLVPLALAVTAGLTGYTSYLHYKTLSNLLKKSQRGDRDTSASPS